MCSQFQFFTTLELLHCYFAGQPAVNISLYGVRYRYEMVGYETEITKTAFRRCGSGNSGINPASYQITSQLTNRLSQRNSLILPTRQKLANCNKHIFRSIRQGACSALLPVFQRQ